MTPLSGHFFGRTLRADGRCAAWTGPRGYLPQLSFRPAIRLITGLPAA